jgi:hypothetical protein
MILAGEPLPPDVEEELASVPTERERSPSDVLDGDDRPDGVGADGTLGTPFFVFFVFLFFFCSEPSSSPDAPPLAAASAIFLGLAGEPLPPDVAEELPSAPTERESSPSNVFDGDDTPDGVAADGTVTVGTPFFVFFVFLFFFCSEPPSSPDAPPLAAASAIFLGLAGEPLPPDVAEEMPSAPTERESSPSDVFEGDDRLDGAAADGTVGTPPTATAAAILDGSAGEPLPETSGTIGVTTVSIGCVDLRNFERFERGDSDEAPQETVLAFAAG